VTTRQWAVLMLGLWASFLAAALTLDGTRRIIVGACIALGFAASTVERWRYWRRHLHAARGGGA
jgi:RsiW-degrading membrane proteinase PrsW (M82 family)